MKQNIRDFLKNLISKREKSTIKQEDNDFTGSLFDKKSTSESVETFLVPTDSEIKKLEDEIKLEKNLSIWSMCKNPEPNVVYDIKDKKRAGIIYPYSEYDADAKDLQGYRAKNFFICRSKALFDELEFELQQNPNCSYITYANDAIKNGDHLNSYSVLFISNGSETANDELASKLLNYYQVPTIYNKTIMIYNGSEQRLVPATLSVDFIKEGYTFYNLQEHNSISFIDIESQINCLKTQARIFNKKLPSDKQLSKDEIEEKAEKISEDYIRSYITRNIILSSTDFDFKNVGLVMNYSTGDIQLAPNFDLESTLRRDFSDDFLITIAIEYFENNYPEILYDIIDKTEKLLTKTKNRISILDTLLETNNHLFLEHSYPNKKDITQKIQSNLSLVKDCLSPNFYDKITATEPQKHLSD